MEILRLANDPETVGILKANRVHWADHVIRMGPDRVRHIRIRASKSPDPEEGQEVRCKPTNRRTLQRQKEMGTNSEIVRVILMLNGENEVSNYFR